MPDRTITCAVRNWPPGQLNDALPSVRRAPPSADLLRNEADRHDELAAQEAEQAAADRAQEVEERLR
jgi:hypothetical protein